MAKKAQQTTELVSYEELKFELAYPQEGEDINAYGERIIAAITDQLAPYVEHFKTTYGNAVAVLDNPESVKFVNAGLSDVVRFRNLAEKAGKEQREPFRKLLQAQKASIDNIIAALAPVEQHLRDEATKIERLEAERIQRMVNDRMAMLTQAGFVRYGSFFKAGNYLEPAARLAEISDEEFQAMLDKGAEELAIIEQQKAEEQQRQAALEAERQARLQAEEELAELKARLAALEATSEPAEEPEPTSEEPVLTRPEDLQLPSAKRPEPAPEPEPEPAPTQTATDRLNFKGVGLAGGRTGAPIGQDYVNGFAKCRQMAIQALQARRDDGSFMYMKRSEMIAAIEALTV